jgi:hypothetical protein
MTRLEPVLSQTEVFQQDYANQDWDLPLNGFVVEDNLLLSGDSVQQPRDTRTACHLEDLWRVRLGERDLLIRQL